MKRAFKAVVVGVSSGGLEALKILVPGLRKDLSVPVLIVQHLSPQADSYLALRLDEVSGLKVKEAEDKEFLQAGVAYVAPPDYHLLVEPDGSLSLSVDPKVNFSRPSVDVLFETASDAFGAALIGVVLTGANQDGAKGLARIKRRGGLAVVQSPESALADAMPRAALESTNVDHVLPLREIAPFLNNLLIGPSHANTD
ncbi:two-component system chemotaxis response regulator CheB [Desulfomicrobium macestii]|uniref:protein-glutamate methylesterase n=1 Tax=Desulfomicrobium macestii TaxID=90731 RepID=A0ABR9GZA9_9BACT|nr:chemotaxis protein CheB [Desulfomicrobium macestii]MBE1423643.1 two-component system chemotaxis response regulator CheB [Desulfomicrobium macestii]